LGYACGATPFPSAGVGAPHIRDRTYFVADADYARSQGRKRVRERAAERAAGSGGLVGVMADAERGPAERQRLDVGSAASGVRSSSREQRLRDDVGNGGDVSQLADTDSRGRASRRKGRSPVGHRSAAESDCSAGELADANGGHACAEGVQRRGQHGQQPEDGRVERIEPAGPTNGFWRAADWLLCRDEK
jgi:DNA (cytosine-5)-methyltransferase 1